MSSYWIWGCSSARKESTCNAGDTSLILRSGRSPGEGIGYPFQYSWASLVAQLVKKSTCNAGDLSFIPGLGQSPREGNGNPLQYSGLENSMDPIVHGVAKSRTWLSDFHFPNPMRVSLKETETKQTHRGKGHVQMGQGCCHKPGNVRRLGSYNTPKKKKNSFLES